MLPLSKPPHTNFKITMFYNGGFDHRAKLRVVKSDDFWKSVRGVTTNNTFAIVRERPSLPLGSKLMTTLTLFPTVSNFTMVFEVFAANLKKKSRNFYEG